MFSKLYNFYVLARESLFYTPALLCFFYVVACGGLYVLESAYIENIESFPLVYNGTLAKAQEVVDTLLGAMITMTTLVISVTMVVLSLSANQHGPRLMKIFMRNQITKIYIGMFFGSVAACFMLTGILHDAASELYIPRLTTSVVFMLCFANLFILLAYVQHVANLSISDQIVTLVYKDLCNSIKRLNGADQRDEKTKKPELPKGFSKNSRAVLASHNNYIQTIDYNGLISIAARYNLVVRFVVKPGDYIIRGTKIFDIYPKNSSTSEVENEIESAIVYGHYRSSSQDLEYSVRHMVEIALRALSPGINDDFTALGVLNKLTAAMAMVFDQGLPMRIYKDDNGKARVFAKASDPGGLIMQAYMQIRNAARDKPAVLLRMLELLSVLKKQARDEGEEKALDEQIAAIEDYIDTEYKGLRDAKTLDDAVKTARKA